MAYLNKRYSYSKSPFVKNFLIGFFLIFLLFPVFSWCKSQNIKILKTEDSRFTEHFKKIKRLPKEFRDKFQRSYKPDKSYRKKDKTDEVNLLVLLVDFVPDDDPKTTGNGKFDFAKYDYFTIDGELDSVQTIGSPPHDSTYFHQTLIALQHYYQTASLGELNSFDLFIPVNFHFKIFPNQADTAYHLPKEMSYYNPDTDDWNLKTERFEEYFKDAITAADTTNFFNTPDIIFSDYNHIMLIHAGSDWQHDVFWDTPCDIPAFFISLEEDSIAVNDSTYFVKEAANIPETISQDFYKYKHLQYGFGALNAEMAHEFGHSLGFVDLYNTNNMYPAVGYWDIMDSGGLTAAFSIDSTVTPKDTLVIEGALPILPSAWTRMLVWGDAFENYGKYCEIISPTDISIDASQIPSASNPQFIKIPINEKEYFLLENRVVDLDGDGTCGIMTDESGRVPLYPMNPESDELNYEYDYMLPTYDKYLSGIFDDNVYTNGGLCIWHIDDSVIYDDIVYVDEKPYSRFEANVVNGSFANKGVKLVEADGIWDIGNPYSNYAAGTAYEPFFWLKPPWDESHPSNPDWIPPDSIIHNVHFGPTTKPNSYSNDDINSLIDIFDISNSNPTMIFKFQYQLYDEVTSKIVDEKFNPENEMLFFLVLIDFPAVAIASDSVFILLLDDDLWGEYSHISKGFDKRISQPFSMFQKEWTNLFFIALEDSIAIADVTSFPDINYFGTKLGSEISDCPIALSEEKILVPTQDSLLIFKIENNDLMFQKNIEANNPKIAYNNFRQEIVSLNSPNSITICDTSFTNIQEFSISSTLGEFYPIIENNGSTQTIYFQDVSGSVYRIDSLNVEKILESSNYNLEEISNIALGDINNDGWHDVVFTASDKIFAIQKNGAFVSGFPQSPYFSDYSPSVSPIIGKSILPENISLFLPTASNWTQAFSETCEYMPNYSFSVGNCLASPYLNLDNSYPQFYLPVSDSLIKIYSFDYTSSERKIYWNGYKNGSERYACVSQISEGKPDTTTSLQVFAFPNPAENGCVKIRINPPNDITAKVSIYNLAAELLFKDEKKVFASRNNEFEWNIDKISSGIYFAVVIAGNQKKLVKIGIEK